MPVFYTYTNQRWKHINDEELLSEFFITKDNRYFTEIFSRYVHLVYFSCYKQLGNDEESKEIVMKIFLKLFEKLRKNKVDLNSFKHWLLVLTRNECINVSRYQQKRNRLSKELWNETKRLTHLEENLFSNVPKNETDLRLQSIELAIKHLSLHQQRCLYLFFFQGKSYKEIAQITAYPEKSVKSYLQNAKRRIKSLLSI